MMLIGKMETLECAPLLTSESDFKPGWYELSLATASDNTGLTCRVDFGDTLPDFQIVDIEKSGTRRFYSVIYLGLCPKRLLFEADAGKELEIGNISLTRCSKPVFYKKLAAKGWGTFKRAPIRNIPRLARSLVSLLSKHAYRQIRIQSVDERAAYQNWMDRFDYNPDQRPDLESRLKMCKHRPLLSILLPVHDVSPKLFGKTVESIRGQVYANWQVSICMDGDTPASIEQYIKYELSDDQRFVINKNNKNRGISKTTMTCFKASCGDWITCLDHDDILREHALAECVLAINKNPDVKIVYSDEDKINIHDFRFDPYFKCDFAPELLLSMNYFGHLTVIRRDMIARAGLWNPDHDGAQDHDLVLRVTENCKTANIIHIPKILYHRRISDDSDISSNRIKVCSKTVANRVVAEHLNRQGLTADVSTDDSTGYNRIRLGLSQAPQVTIIIPTKNKHGLLKTCITSILKKTEYENFDILVINNASDEIKSIKYLEDLQRHPTISVTEYANPFNYSAINNFAVERTQSDVLCFLNNDVKALSKGWMREMLSWLSICGVGCVGAKLIYPNRTVQHAGVVLGIGGVTGHAHKYYPKNASGYFDRLMVVQNFSAVTGACMMVRRDDFLSVGGFDEDSFPISYNDVDLCLKLNAIGLRTVWTPHAVLVHYESASRGKLDMGAKLTHWAAEARAFREKWQILVDDDPYYSPNLSRTREDFSLRT